MVKLNQNYKKFSSDNKLPYVEQADNNDKIKDKNKIEDKDMSSYFTEKSENIESSTTSTVNSSVVTEDKEKFKSNDNLSMFEKSQTTPKTENNGNVLLKVIGLAIVIFGLLAILILSIIALVTRINPRVDKTMERPIILNLPEYTNQENLKVEGTVNGTPQVIIYVDGNVNSVVDVIDGRFEKVIKLNQERKYSFEVAGVKGIILRTRSEKSDIRYSTLDKTAPSSLVELIDVPKEVTTSNLDINGKAEPNSIVTIDNGEKEYSANVDSEGRFSISSVVLEPKDNTFSISVKDLAGNVTKIVKNFTIVYSPKAAVNGNGVAASTTYTPSKALPNSAGPLDEAMAELFQNKFIFGFGIFALILFIVNSVAVGYKLRKENNY